MNYMDHHGGSKCDPVPTVEEEYRVGIRVVGGTGVIHINVTALSWEHAQNKAMLILQSGSRVESCLSKGQY